MSTLRGWRNHAVLLAALSLPPKVTQPACPAGTTPRSDPRGELTVEMCIDGEQHLHGKAITHDRLDNVIAEDEWEHGEKAGTWKTWYTGGQLRSQRVYGKGTLQGAYFVWALEGQPVIVGRFVDDKEEGPWLVIDPKDRDQVSFVVYENGKDVTAHLNPPPATCSAWALRGYSYQMGFLVSLSLEAAHKLPPQRTKTLRDWPEFSVCLLRGGPKSLEKLGAACKGGDLHAAGPQIAVELAEHCIPTKAAR